MCSSETSPNVNVTELSSTFLRFGKKKDSLRLYSKLYYLSDVYLTRMCGFKTLLHCILTLNYVPYSPLSWWVIWNW